MSKQYIITGCPRSGTGYAARVLNLGHECIDKKKNGVASWCLSYPLPLYGPNLLECSKYYSGAKIYHQIRNPADVLSSFMDDEKSMSQTAWKFFAYIFDLDLEKDSSAVNAMKIYIKWNSLSSLLTNLTYRVEEMNKTFDIKDSEYYNDTYFNGGFKKRLYKDKDFRDADPDLWGKCESIYHEFEFFMSDELEELIEEPKPLKREFYSPESDVFWDNRVKMGYSRWEGKEGDFIDTLKFL